MSLTKEQAKRLYDSEFWEDMTPFDRCNFQIHENRLCMPFGVFHEAVEETLGRSVWTHEFAHPEMLREELRGVRPSPTFGDIMDLIPEDKPLILKL